MKTIKRKKMKKGVNTEWMKENKKRIRRDGLEESRRELVRQIEEKESELEYQEEGEILKEN